MLFLKDLGPFTNLVATAGSILAMGAAIGLGWRRRTKWEPAEEDIAGGPQKVGGLLGAVTIAIIFGTMNDAAHVPVLSKWAFHLLVLTTASLITYGLLVSLLTYYIEIVIGNQQIRRVNIIGGFWIKKGIRRKIGREEVTIQEFLKGTAYNVDAVWPRLARALAKQSFVLAYLGLTVCGTVALACAALVIGLRQ